MKSQEQAKRTKAPTPTHDSWARPKPRVRPCLRCGQPRLSSSPADRFHKACRPNLSETDDERAGCVL